MLDGQIALYEVKPLSEIGKICHRAAEIIEERGLSDGPLECEDGRVCMGRALTLSAGRGGWDIDFLASMAYRLGLNEPYHESEFAAPFKNGCLAGAIANWSDKPGRTVAEVAARLRSVK